MGADITITWPELDRSVRATLAESESPELVAEFSSAMPFGVVQSHPVVSGSSVTMWLPYLSKAPTPAMESIVDAPIGRIRLSQGTGSKISIQYGPGLEPAKQAVLGQVHEDDLPMLPEVGRRVWDNLFWLKQPLSVHFSAPDGPDAPPSPAPLQSEVAQRMSDAADAIQLDEPQDVARLRTGQVPDAGSFGQYFSVWDAAHGLVRDFVINTLYPIYAALLRDGVATARTAYDVVGTKYHFTLGYHGWIELSSFAQEFHEVLSNQDDAASIQEVLEQLLRYGNALYAWSHQSFPWYVAMNFPLPGAGPVGGRWVL
ncbi:hypothetical protein [Nocardioides bigeumensis]|uniref:Cucumopine synthase C-terminal helical bundle domain-containing protein n=1 Tax=Nocardioides bigeumensis TaxID=433657 RepID=A0ABP5J968_9ACTN